LDVLKQEVMDLQVHLTDGELLTLAKQQSELIGKIEGHKKRAASVKAQLNADLTSLEAQLNAIATTIREQSTIKPVRVEHRADWPRNVVKVVRLDTGETIRERIPSEDERQQPMLTVEGGPEQAEGQPDMTPLEPLPETTEECEEPDDVG
jgi:hypothetical protein